MFSCYRAARLTYDRLERPLTRRERAVRWGHLFICRHCRTHELQVRGLARLMELKKARHDNPGLPAAARDRIRTALAGRFPSP
jgi:hypothetical protein